MVGLWVSQAEVPLHEPIISNSAAFQAWHGLWDSIPFLFQISENKKRGLIQQMEIKFISKW